MDQLLKDEGIYFDEVDKIRILDPEVATQANVLKDECKIYLEKVDEFQKLIDGFIGIMDKIALQVDRQKLQAMGAKNILQTMEKQRDIDSEQLQAVITEKSMELQRLNIQLNSLQKTEMEQNEIINKLTSN